MKPSHEEKMALRLEFCERCAPIGSAAVSFARCVKDRMVQNYGYRPL